MRMKLGASPRALDPIVLTLADGIPFIPSTYIAQGYTKFDVVCIGASGGAGGSILGTNLSGANKKIHGGAGGGGGLHLVSGLLSALPSSVPVVVGVRGNPGASTNRTGTTNVTTPTDGQRGGYSAFNSSTCVAAGGGGGYAAIVFSDNTGIGGQGGRGGLGGGTTGYGGIGGYNSPVSAGIDGTWDGTIGGGGGGDCGGYANFDGSIIRPPSLGGRGSWSNTDQTMYGPPDSLSSTVLHDDLSFGGGAKAFLLNDRKDLVWGGSGSSGLYKTGNGAVIIKLYDD